MSVLFDTSVLVAGLVEAHPSHRAAFPWVRRVHAGRLQGAIAAHSLAELYAVLTTLPHRPRITPEASLKLIQETARRFRVVPLGRRDYARVTRVLADAGLVGGIIYDGLIAYAAVKSRAERLLTLNRRDFDRLRTVFGIDVVAL